jgi:carbamoyl-phosphate synthase small subunit
MLVLEDGTVHEGSSFGAPGEATGEIVFNTSMTGYQEILTDPSYCGQMVVMTYPLMGNYGVNPQDFESPRPHVRALIVREVCRYPSNWRSSEPLDDFLGRFGIVGIEGVDTRGLTRHIRTVGAMRAIVSSTDLDEHSLLEKVRNAPGMIGANLVDEVTCDASYVWRDPNSAEWQYRENIQKQAHSHVVVYDFGVKHNILRKFSERGCRLTVVPARTSAADVLEVNPDGVFLSNGPGDPEAVEYVIPEIRALLDKKPVFGICLGQQLMGIALGGHTYKLKFGHRGANHPVKNLETGVIEITSQNHGFNVDPKSLNEKEIQFTHWNLYDGTLEGFRHRELPIFSVQYHPEASPGPHDSDYLFNRFLESMEP